MKNRIVLFQPFLRQHILNFDKALKDFAFFADTSMAAKKSPYTHLPDFEKEVTRIKVTPLVRFRRLFGILNVRFRWEKEPGILFTYGCMLLTNKPYCVYVENGLAIYNYDLQIAKNPIARMAFSFLVQLPQCEKLFFMSDAARKSFFATIPYSKRVREIVQKKSQVLYPLIERKPASVKKFADELRLLFVGQYYMKGGVELTKAFARIREKYPFVSLTIVTPLQTLREEDKAWVESIPGLSLLDAAFSFTEMQAMYAEYDIFLLPTYRDSFGLVLIEALAWGMPIICTDQYATAEMVVPNENGFVISEQPLRDYDPQTYRLLGKYYNPKAFYEDYFAAQREGRLDPIEESLVTYIGKYAEDTNLLEEHSKRSLALFEEKFAPEKIGQEIEEVFQEILEKNTSAVKANKSA